METIFIQNKYYNWYYTLIDKRKTNIIKNGEKHHIIPKSLGGTNDKENLIQLTPREHFIAHLLLSKFTTGENKKKMYYALWIMAYGVHKKYYRVTSRIYENLKNIHNQQMIGNKFNKAKNKKWYNDGEKSFMLFEKEGQLKQLKKGRIGMRIRTYYAPWSDEAKKKASDRGAKNFWCYNPKNEKEFGFKQQLPIGWCKGRPSNAHTNINMTNACKGIFWWNNGIISIKSRIKPNGFNRGRLRFK